MATAESIRDSFYALGCHPGTGAKTIIEPSPAYGVIPTANPSDAHATAQVVGKKLSHGLN